MDCPVCGEEIPLNQSECPNCGEQVDRFFLTEEVEGSRVRRKAGEVEKAPTEPSSQARKRPLERSRLVAVIIAVVFLLALAVLALLLLVGGGGVPDTPDGVVNAYYEALQKSDFETMKSYFANAYLPTGQEQDRLASGVSKTDYAVTGPSLVVLADEGKSARVAIEALQVKESSPGGTVRHDLSRDVLQGLHSTDPEARIVVELSRDSGIWRIVERPYGGWQAENL
jgi:hypothetical protein